MLEHSDMQKTETETLARSFFMARLRAASARRACQKETQKIRSNISLNEGKRHGPAEMTLRVSLHSVCDQPIVLQATAYLVVLHKLGVKLNSELSNPPKFLGVRNKIQFGVGDSRVDPKN